LPPLSAVTAPPPLNRTWRTDGATELARGQANSEPIPPVAAWFSGAGAVIAAAFNADPTIATALADRVAVPPRDPRFKISWQLDSNVRARVTATENDRPLNDLQARLVLSVGGAGERTIVAVQDA